MMAAELDFLMYRTEIVAISCGDVTTVATKVGPQGKARRTKTFRSYDQDQTLLMPPSLCGWLPDSHTARFISEIVDECLDLSGISDSYGEGSSAPPYDPAMMFNLLLYAYSSVVTSSRTMERR
jgi:hypothetical protein